MKRKLPILLFVALFISPLLALAVRKPYFIENKGQISDMKGNCKNDILYKYEGEGINIYFLKNKLIYHFYKTEEKKKHEYSEKDNENFKNGNYASIGKKVYFYRVDLDIINGNGNVQVEPGKKINSYSNYYLKDTTVSLAKAEHFEKITYRGIYKGVDLAFYFEEGKLKYDFIIAPGANYRQIKLKYQGIENIEALGTGELRIKAGPFGITEGKPFTYNSKNKTEIGSDYVLNGSTITFDLENFDNALPIVIDPVVTWSTYFNNGSSSDTWTKPEFDKTGAIYNAGYTYYSTFPVLDAGNGQYFDSSKEGITDLVIVKFNSNYSLAWCTYYGGDGGDYIAGYSDYGRAIAVDDDNNLYVAGQTAGTVFPTYDPGSGAFYQDQTRIYNETSFIVKFNSNGVRQWATVFQHENANTLPSSIRINGINTHNNYLYITGQTYRFNSNDIPLRTLAGAYNNPTWKGPQDVFLGRFSPSHQLEWCTYFNDGGLANASYRQGADLTFDKNGNMWFVGRHTSSAANAGHYLLNSGGGAYYQGFNNGDQDLIITKFNSSLVPVHSTYYGGNDQDVPSMIECNSAGDAAIVLKAARSTNFPVYDPGGSYYQPTKAYISSFDSDAAIVKFRSDFIRQWSTYYGGSAGPSLFSGVGFDHQDKMYVFGSTQASNFPLQTLTGSYNDNSMEGAGDVVLLRFSSTGVREWATFYGGSGNETLHSSKGEVMVTGCTTRLLTFPQSSSTDYPTVNPGGGAFYETTSLTANVNTILLLEDDGGSYVAPASATASVGTICTGGTTTLSVNGGSAGSTGSWKWYSGSCGGTLAGSGASITVSPVTNTTYYVRAEGTCGNTSCATVAVTVNSNSASATGIDNSVATICPGSSSTLSINGGTLGTGASWTWYSESCGGTVAGTGTSITVSPSSTTTYYVRAEGTCNTTICVSTVVSLNTNSSAASSVSVTEDSICPGATSTLSINGGTLGTGADWKWYPTSCGGTPVGTGASVTVSPSDETEYFVRAEGTCNTTTCSSAVIIVKKESAAPVSIDASKSTLCSDESATLTVNGGSLGTGGKWQWYTESCGGTSVQSGNSLTVSPAGTTTYYARAEGQCNTTLCANALLTVNAKPAAPASDNSGPACAGGSIQLNSATVSGASYNWTGPDGFTSDLQNPLRSNVTESMEGDYKVSITINGCASDESITQVVINPIPQVPVLYYSSSVCIGATIQLDTDLVGGGSYQWAGPDGFSSMQKNPSILNASLSESGTYTLTITDASGCEASSTADITVSNCTSISSPSFDEDNKFYPNPTMGSLTVEISHDSEVELINQYGQVVYKNKLKKGIYMLNLTDQSGGVYYLRYKNQDSYKSVKIVKH